MTDAVDRDHVALGVDAPPEHRDLAVDRDPVRRRSGPRRPAGCRSRPGPAPSAAAPLGIGLASTARARSAQRRRSGGRRGSALLEARSSGLARRRVVGLGGPCRRRAVRVASDRGRPAGRARAPRPPRRRARRRRAAAGRRACRGRGARGTPGRAEQDGLAGARVAGDLVDVAPLLERAHHAVDVRRRGWRRPGPGRAAACRPRWPASRGRPTTGGRSGPRARTARRRRRGRDGSGSGSRRRPGRARSPAPSARSRACSSAHSSSTCAGATSSSWASRCGSTGSWATIRIASMARAASVVIGAAISPRRRRSTAAMSANTDRSSSASAPSQLMVMSPNVSAWSRSTRPCLNSSSTARNRTTTSSRSTRDVGQRPEA